MEHVHTFLFSKLCSSKERRLIFATPETPDVVPPEGEASPDAVADGEVDLVENFLDGMSAEELRALKKTIDELLDEKEPVEGRPFDIPADLDLESLVNRDGDDEPAPPALPEDGEAEDEEPVEAPEPPVEEEPVDEEPVEAPEPPVEEEPVEEDGPVDPEFEPNVASELLDAAAGDSALVLAGALETGDFEGANTARLDLQATLFDMVMSADVNGGDINAWLEDKFPTFEVSYNEADMTIVIPALEDFTEEEPEEEEPVEAPEPPIEEEPEAAPELSETMREILDGIAGPELDQVLRLDEMLDESNPESQLVMDQAIRELIQELAPQVDNGNITEEEINLWLREAFEGQQIPVYDHESGTITVTEEVDPVADPIEEEPTDAVPAAPEGESEASPEEIENAKSEIASAVADTMVPIAADMATDPIDESSVAAINEELASLEEQFGVVPDDQEAELLKPLQDTLEGKGLKVEKNGEGVYTVVPIEAAPNGGEGGQDQNGETTPESIREMIAEFFRELLKLLREGLAEARAQREQNANAPTTVTEADANVAAADAGVEAAEAAVAEAAEEVTTAETDAATAGTDTNPETQTEIEGLRERVANLEEDAEVSREEAARVREERDALLQRIAEQQTRIEELLIANNGVEAEIQVDPDAGLEGGIIATDYDTSFEALVESMMAEGAVDEVRRDGGALYIHFNINYIENNIGGSNNNVINQQGEGNQADVDAGTDEPVEEVPAEEEPIEEEVEEDTTSSTDGDEFADL